MVKSLWAMVQGDPAFMRRVNGWLAVFWILMIPVSFLMGWLSSVVYVSALSLWALVSGHWSAWQAARVEVAQQEQAEMEAHKDIAGEVVTALVDRTTVRTDDSAAASVTTSGPTSIASCPHCGSLLGGTTSSETQH